MCTITFEIRYNQLREDNNKHQFLSKKHNLMLFLLPIPSLCCITNLYDPHIDLGPSLAKKPLLHLSYASQQSQLSFLGYDALAEYCLVFSELLSIAFTISSMHLTVSTSNLNMRKWFFFLQSPLTLSFPQLSQYTIIKSAHPSFCA